MPGIYETGADMWRDYMTQYGDAEARGICNRYLDLHIRAQDPEELRFCRELYAAMQADPLIKPMTAEHKESVLALLERAKGAAMKFDAGAGKAKKPPGMEI